MNPLAPGKKAITSTEITATVKGREILETVMTYVEWFIWKKKKGSLIECNAFVV